MALLVCSATVLLASAVLPANASTAADQPPFTECPAIGSSRSCEILLVVNPDNSVSVLHDGAVGPYDGGDDTLVGIVNESSSPVQAVTVSGVGTDLAGFDGDGLCTFGVNGCPFGSTGYEGPGTSFHTSPSLPDHAEVDFTGGLKPGGTAYFSLENDLSSAQLVAREGHLATLKYVAFGDSLTTGFSIPKCDSDRKDSPWGCFKNQPPPATPLPLTSESFVPLREI